MKKISLLLLLLLLFSCLLSVSAGATADPASYIVDKDNCLSATEEQALAQLLEDGEEGTSCHLVLYIYRPRNGQYVRAVEMFAYDIIDKPQNVMVLEIAVETTQITFVVHHFGDTSRVSQRELEYLEDLLEPSIKAGDYLTGVGLFAENAKTAFEGKLINYPKLLGISVLVALVVASIAAGCTVASYRRKVHSAVYPLDKFTNLHLTEEYDKIIGRNVTRRPISSGSSGSSHGGGGRSGGGGHSSGSRR